MEVQMQEEPAQTDAETITPDALHFFESLDRINRAIQGTSDLDDMMHNVLEEVRSIFDCDRAYLLYPCNPDSDSWTVPMESTCPEYPGAGIMNVDIPMDQEVAEKMRILLACDGALKFGPGTEHPLPPNISQRFGLKSFIATALHPKSGDVWEFGIHQCTHGRIWTDGEERLFLEIGRRVTDGLTSLLVMRELQESEANYRRFVETSTEGIWAFDRNQATTFVNARMNEMVGYSSDELIRHPLSDFMFEEDIADHERHMELRRQGGAEHYERRFRCKDGSELWTLASATPFFNDDGEFQGSFAMFNDITDRKRMEQDLIARELDFRTLVENSPDPILRYDRDCRRVYVNPVIQQISGIALESLIGFKPGDTQLLSDSEAKKLTTGICRVFDSNQPYHIDFEFIDLNGDLHGYDMLLIPEHDADGQVVTVLGIARDITERKRTEQRMALLEHALNQSSDAIYLMDEKTTRFNYVNDAACRNLGYSREELLSMSPVDIDPDMPIEKTRALTKEVVEGHPLCFETRHQARNGRIFPVEIHASPVEFDGSMFSLAMAHDITERKQAEEALHREKTLLSRIMVTSPVGITVVNREGQITFANPQAESILGLSKQAIA